MREQAVRQAVRSEQEQQSAATGISLRQRNQPNPPSQGLALLHLPLEGLPLRMVRVSLEHVVQGRLGRIALARAELGLRELDLHVVGPFGLENKRGLI